MTEHLLPISKTNVVSLVNRETTYKIAPTTASSYKKLAFNANSLARQQTLTPNPELRGNRMQGALVVGPKNPGGPFQGYQTDQTLPMFYEATFGTRVTTEVGACGVTLTVTQSATVGSTPPESGAHSYVIVISKGGSGTAKRTLHSGLNVVAATITADGTHKVHIARSGGTLPTGWTWAIYRTAAAADPTVVANYELVSGTLTLAANVVSFDDDTADATLTTAVATSSDTGYGDYQHIITVGQTLPSYTIERSLPFLQDAAKYIRAVGCKIDTAKVQFKSTGYFDLQTAWLAQSVATFDASADSGTPSDWRFGEKIHQAMVGQATVLVGPSSGGLAGASVFGKFMDVSIDHNNNLDKTDYPLGLAGDRGSLTELQAISTITGTLKISDPSALALIQSAPDLQLISFQHDLATFGHKIIHTFYGCQFDPMDPQVSGQGILTAGFTAHAVQDPTSNLQVQITIVNGEPTGSYDANT